MTTIIAVYERWACDAVVAVGRSGRAYVVELRNFEKDGPDNTIETPKKIPDSVMGALRLDALHTFHRDFGVLNKAQRTACELRP